ncbi:hypothetical protein RZS08_58345, partial [Arthrospira platensis SPKY1]|nr:hypothetical protein [Arthrospira platensis SPKY1]
AERDHCGHILGIGFDIADVQIETMTLEKSQCLPAPWATGFDIKNGFFVFTAHFDELGLFHLRE